MPAVAISIALACGIAIGLHPAVARSASSRGVLLTSLCVAAALILTGILLARVHPIPEVIPSEYSSNHWKTRKSDPRIDRDGAFMS
jgi:hypothetical protein